MKNKFKSYIIFLFCSIFIANSILSDERINRLKNELNTSNEFQKSKILNMLTDRYIHNGEIDKIISLSNQSIVIAKKHSQIENLIYANANLSFGYRKKGLNLKALEQIQLSIKKSKELRNTKLLIYSLRIQANILQYIPNKYSELLQTYKGILPLYEELGDKKGKAKCLRNIGIAYMYLENINSSLSYLKQSLKYYESLKDKNNTIHLMELIGSNYLSKGKKAEALDILFRAVRIGENSNFKIETGRVLLALGRFYYSEKNLDQSLLYYKKALNSFMNLIEKNYSYISTSYTRLGDIYFLKGDYNQSKQNFELGLNLGEKHFGIDFEGSQYIYCGLGRIFLESGNIYKAIDYLKRARTISFKKKDISSEAKCLRYLSEAYLKVNRINESLISISKSIDAAKELGDKELQLDNCLLLSRIYETTDNYYKALKSYKQMHELKFDVFTENKVKNIAEIESKYQVEQKEKENELLKKNNEIQRLDIERQKIVRNLAIVILVLILIIIGFLIKKYSFLLAFWKKRSFIGHYKLGEKIGSGGSGIVYKANDIHDKTREVAIKILREESSSDENYKKRFKSEGSIIDRFDHPNIVKVIERGESGNTLFLVMEHLKGKSLDKIIEEESPLEYTRIYTVLSEIVSAVSSIHKKNIIHRDLKPENVIIVENEKGDEQAKLLDFGIAKSKDITSLTKTGSVLGTIHYLAPEQIQMGEITFKSDIYSIGVICYELVTGVKPFYAEEEEYILSKIISDEAPAPKILREDIPQDLNVIILNMMEKNPKLRPEIGDIFKYFSSKLEGENKRE